MVYPPPEKKDAKGSRKKRRGERKRNKKSLRKSKKEVGRAMIQRHEDQEKRHG